MTMKCKPMTVADLIAALQEHPLDARVVKDRYEDGYHYAIGVVGITLAEDETSDWLRGRLQPSSIIDPRSLYAVLLTTDRRRRKARAPSKKEVRDLAADVIGSREAARDWLAMPAIAFQRRKPRDMMATAEGRRMVAMLLEQIRYGVYV